MLSVEQISFAFGERVLFKDVSLKFTAGNCYGIIGANGAGKSTFLKLLSGEMQVDQGRISKGTQERLAVLRQDQFAFDHFTVMETVLQGHSELYAIASERDALYAKEDFSEADGLRAGELEALFAEQGGYEAESEASVLLKGLGLDSSFHDRKMSQLEGGERVRVLLAQALFGNPDILILDEPTNHLDLPSIHWLEEFLIEFKNITIIVSHDRHFINQVCTHVADIDYQKIQLYVGNYDFWYEASQLAAKQRKDEKKRSEDKIAELKVFVQRFSANASKSKQATSRKKLIEKLTLEDIKPSSRRFPYVHFKPERDLGKSVLRVEKMNSILETGERSPSVTFTVESGDKIAFLGDAQRKTTLFDALFGRGTQVQGVIEWGSTVFLDYFSKDHEQEFSQSNETVVEWLRQFSKEKDDAYVRGFLGRMLFTSDEVFKELKVLSGGERVRCTLARMMLKGANVLIFDEPTNHLDLEAISALNDALITFPGVVLFSSHDQQFVQTIAQRIIELTPQGYIDRHMTFDEYENSPEVEKLRLHHWGEEHTLSL